METGDVLFESHSSRFDTDYGDAAMQQQQQSVVKFDFSVPDKRSMHPLDPTISTQSLKDANVISLRDLLDGKAGITLKAYTDFIGGGRAAT